MLTFIASLLVTVAPAEAQVPWVVTTDGTVHAACADYGPTVCYGGTVFADDRRVAHRAPSYSPGTAVTVPCDTDADCAARNPHVTGYGN